MASFSTRYMVFSCNCFLPACCRREKRVGRELWSFLSCSLTRSVLVVVRSSADILVIDQQVSWYMFFSCILVYPQHPFPDITCIPPLYIPAIPTCVPCVAFRIFPALTYLVVESTAGFTYLRWTTCSFGGEVKVRRVVQCGPAGSISWSCVG